MAEVRRSARQRRAVDYKRLAGGPDLPNASGGRKQTWSTSKLFPLEVTDSNLVDNKLMVKVHYTDPEWSHERFDEWRDAADIVDIPASYIQYNNEIKDLFLTKLRLSVKEALHCQRKVDSIVNIVCDIPRDLFPVVFNTPLTFSKHRLDNLDDWNSILGASWNYRIVNSKGDFAFVTTGTVSFWIRERRPLEEFNADGCLELLHRGFIFHVKFGRGLGNKHDFLEYVK